MRQAAGATRLPALPLPGAPRGELLFGDPGIPLTPPTLPESFPDAVAAVTAAADSGPLYRPMIDFANNLTCIDFCIKGKSK